MIIKHNCGRAFEEVQYFSHQFIGRVSEQEGAAGKSRKVVLVVVNKGTRELTFATNLNKPML